jgi:hypothetical protein
VNIQRLPYYVKETELRLESFSRHFYNVSIGNALQRQSQESANTTEEFSYLKPQPSFSQLVTQPDPIIVCRGFCCLIIRSLNRSVVGIYSAEEVQIGISSLILTCTFLYETFAILCHCSQVYAPGDREKVGLVINEVYLLIEGREVSKAAVAQDQCASGMPDIHTRVRSTEIKIGFRCFNISAAVSTRIIHKVLERFDTLFAVKRQCCTNHLCPLFKWEQTDHTISIHGILDGFPGVFQPRHHTGLADNRDC